MSCARVWAYVFLWSFCLVTLFVGFVSFCGLLVFCCVEFGSSLVALYRADAHFPMFLGEVMSVFRILW